jgi:hypothetical protein
MFHTTLFTMINNLITPFSQGDASAAYQPSIACNVVLAIWSKLRMFRENNQSGLPQFTPLQLQFGAISGVIFPGTILFVFS